MIFGGYLVQSDSYGDSRYKRIDLDQVCFEVSKKIKPFKKEFLILFLLKDNAIIYFLAKYIVDFLFNGGKSICRLIRISRQDIISHIQNVCELELKPVETYIDLASSFPKCYLANLKYLSKFIF